MLRPDDFRVLARACPGREFDVLARDIAIEDRDIVGRLVEVELGRESAAPECRRRDRDQRFARRARLTSCYILSPNLRTGH